MIENAKTSDKQLANEKSERIMQGVAYWASFYRHQHNPQKFVKDYLNINLDVMNIFIVLDLVRN